MKPYPTYKESGVEFLNRIPEHWEKRRFGFMVNFNKGLNITKADLRDAGIPCISYGEVHSKYGFAVNPDKHALRYVEEKYLAESPRSLLSEGDFVFADTSEDVEGAGNFTYLNSTTRAFAGYHTIIARATKPILPRFMAYQLDAMPNRAQIQNKVSGIKVFSISQGILKNVILFLPPLSEQRAIAAYLDRETAKIDTLIAKQEQLITLLEEKRQSLISHAVTKGIDPHVKIKDSGVEWLGKVPEHWEVKRIGNIYCESVRSGNDTLPILSVSIHSGISDKELNDEELDRKVARSEDKSKYKEVYANDLVYNMMRAWQGAFGAATLHGMVSPAYIVARPKRNINSQWVELLLRTPKAVEELRRYSRGITDFRLRLYWDEFKSIYIVLPPESEISEILSSIDASMAKIDALVERASASIKLLNEKRSSIISAVVTGKIDVRDEVEVESLSA